MPIGVRITMHEDRIRATLRDPAGPAARFVRERCQMAVNYAKAACPVDQGKLRQSITSRVDAAGGRVVGTIGTPVPYGRYLHEGTGIYGPRHAFIYPQRGRYLVFETKGVIGPLRRGAKRKPKGRRDLVFARRVRGIPPNPFLVRGLERAMPGIPVNYYL